MRLTKISWSLFLLGLLSISTLNPSCTKASASTPSTPTTTESTIYGVWEGTYTTDGVSHAPMGVSFAIFPDGTIVKRAKVVGSTEVQTTIGTWSMSGSVLSYTDTSVGYSGGVTHDNASFTVSNNVLISGIWLSVAGPSPGTTGKFQSLKKVN